MMNHLMRLISFMLVFVQIVNGQTGCRLALDSVSSTCISYLNNGDTSRVCSGTCRSQLRDVLATCSSFVS